MFVIMQSDKRETTPPSQQPSGQHQYAANLGWLMYWESPKLQKFLEAVPLPVRDSLLYHLHPVSLNVKRCFHWVIKAYIIMIETGL